MSDFMETRTGPYHHSLKWACHKTFENGREFFILISSAYNEKGHIRPQMNGLVVLDLDNELLLLDGHLCHFRTGIDGPTEEQIMCFYDWCENDSYTNFMFLLEDCERYSGPAIMSSLIERGFAP